MTDLEEHFKEKYLKCSERDLVIRHIGTNNSREREDISIDIDRRLIKEIKKFNKQSSGQTSQIIFLTVVLGVIALLQLILLFKQT